jgi:hypothetical protein
VRKIWLVLLIFFTQVFSQNQLAYPSSNCSTGGECKVGDIGPGGGVVIYADPNLKGWGRYIEAAPKGWYKDRLDPQQKPYCPERQNYVPFTGPYLLNTSAAIGEGLSNSLALTKICPTGATAIAMAYENNGFRDWFLPSMYEINEMYYVKSVGLERSWYWTSTTTTSHQVTSLSGIDGFLSGIMSSTNGWKIRPVRYFSSAADKAAADKAAADKAAADKAAADKAAADKAAADKAAADKAAAIKKTTITCVKGKLNKKVTATKPKCPAGYKKK